MFEAHITVRTTDVDKFVKDCTAIGVKPIVIELEVPRGTERQVMTSETIKEPYVEGFRSRSILRLSLLGYKIVREKYEVHPNYKGKVIYYESHIRTINAPAEFTSVANQLGLHRSRNLFKKEEGKDYRMFTYRSYTDTKEEFLLHIEQCKNLLRVWGIQFDKVEVEGCVFDSNSKIDRNWLKTELEELIPTSELT